MPVNRRAFPGRCWCRAMRRKPRPIPLFANHGGSRLLRAAAWAAGQRRDPQSRSRSRFGVEVSGPVRLTGPVPMNDDEFATIKENAALNAIVTIAVVLFILWLALRWWRIIFAVFVSLAVGLVDHRGPWLAAWSARSI